MDKNIKILINSKTWDAQQKWIYFLSLNIKTEENYRHIIGFSMGFANKLNLNIQFCWMLALFLRNKLYGEW